MRTIRSRSVNGMEFRTVEHGGSTAPVIVLLHGFPQDATCWDDVAAVLASAGYRTVAPDLRGYSAETRTGRQADYSVELLVADVASLIEQLGGSAHVVGHDWGGSLLWTLRSVRPDLVTSATIVSSPHPAALAWAMTHSVDQPLKSWYIGAISLPWLPETFLKHRLADFLEHTGLPRDRAIYYQERANEPGSATAMLAWYRQMIVDRIPVPGRPRKSDAPVSHGASTPVTYVWGTADRFLGRAAAERTARRRDVTFRPIEGAGHWLPETDPDDVVAAVLESVRRGDH